MKVIARVAIVGAVIATALAGCTTDVAAPSDAPPSDQRTPGWSRPVADPLYPQYGNPALDVLTYDLDLAWQPTKRQLTGTATLTIRVVRAVTDLTLDFATSYTVDGVSVDGASATVRRGDNDLIIAATVPAERVVTLAVRYHGTPGTVAMPSGRGDFDEGLGLRADRTGAAWTMQEPYGAFTWYPVNDQPSDEALYDVSVTVPKGWAAVANGGFVGVTSSSAGETYQWKSADPVASYLATLAIDHYTMITDTGPGDLPITYWLRTGRDEARRSALAGTPELLRWLEQRFGPYPFDSAGVVLVNSASAMETQQMLTYGALLSENTDETREVLLHEFAHQWFGDSVTPTDWTGVWLNEGWAMYAEWLWTVDTLPGYTNARWVNRARQTDAYSRPIAGPPGHPKADHFGESNVYLGPALMLHLIHQEVGDKAFFAMARDWVQTQRNAQVDRAMFVAFVNKHTGHDFTKLIDDWLDSPSTPI